MRLAVSSIAWKPEDDEAIGGALRAAGADGVELAPTAWWSDPLIVERPERRRVGGVWRAAGFQVPAIQSLLYGFPELQLFDDQTRPELVRRLVGMLDVAVDLGAGILVFGSPKNRLRNAMGLGRAQDIARGVFAEVGSEAQRRGVCFCIEPNPPAYGCDFIQTAREGGALVESVGSPGFGLHLDTAGALLAGCRPEADARDFAPLIRHVHLSAPGLAAVDDRSPVDYAAVLRALRLAGYAGWISIEMRSEATLEARVTAVGTAVRTARTAEAASR
ncbi:MAG: sugar phosphate isomerase/epimerase [Anaeromyxobacter sp.]|nr:sugar phosphate isomerase/epimerase [Anaeromyxobacter sp.]